MTSVSGGNRPICGLKDRQANLGLLERCFLQRIQRVSLQKKTVISRIGLTVLRFWRTDKKMDTVKKTIGTVLLYAIVRDRW
jgi:hypothetical protein